MTPAWGRRAARATRPLVGLCLVLSLGLAVPVVVVGQGDASEIEVIDQPVLGQQLSEPTAVDQQLIDRIIGDFGVDTQRPNASLASYLATAGDKLFDAIRQWLTPRLSSFELIITWGPRLLALVLVVIVLALLVQWLRHRRPTTTAPTMVVEAQAALGQPAQDREQRLRSALAAGDVGHALAALWWWLAERLSSREVDPSWTSRELMVRAERPDLRPQIRRFDRMLYGSDGPTVGDIEELWRQLQERLA